MSTTRELSDDEVIDLEPTLTLEAAEVWEGVQSHPRASLDSEGGSLASLSGDSDSLRRRRLLAASIFLAAAFSVLTAWTFASDNPGTLSADGSSFSLRVGLLGLRCLLTACLAGLLASEIPLSRKQLRAVEYTLFLGLTLLAMANVYFVGSDLMRRGPDYAPIVLAFVKDGVIQMLVLMMIYGMLIPNPPALAARVLIAMFLGPIIAVFFLRMNPEVVPLVTQLGQAEEAGSNVLFLGIGATLAIYGAYLVNGMRTQLSEALKFGQYKLVRMLGSGGMGEVYLAEHALLKRPCALKLIKPEAGADPLALARFEREVQATAKLAHNNTIDIYDFGHAEDGTFYYVMEYLTGMSLDDLVKNHGPLPAGRAIYLFRQVCAGLAEAHGLGLIHRDLKPANVFVAILGGETDVVKVLDFGLVKVTKEPKAIALTAEMTVSGTPHYMSPEQATADRSLDARSDIYALGAMLYFALTGRPPFQGENAFALLMAHARDPVTKPSEINPTIPHDLEDVVLRCLAKKAADRFPTVKALSEALAGCAAASAWGPNRADAWWASVGAVEQSA